MQIYGLHAENVFILLIWGTNLASKKNPETDCLSDKHLAVYED